MASVSCAYCSKPLSKGYKGKNNDFYCNVFHRAMGEPNLPIQGGLISIVVGIVFFLFLPGWTLRGTPIGPLFLIIGPIVLLFGLYFKYMKKPEQTENVN